MANGQCMVVRRAWLQAEGGFKVAASHMTDDIAFARAMARRGRRVVFLDGSQVIDVEMYTSTFQVWREWGRSLPMADVVDTRTAWVDLGTLWLTSVFPLLRMIRNGGNVLDKILVGMRFALCIPLARAYDRPLPAVALSPLLDVISVGRLTQTTLRPVTTWRGRDYAQSGNENR